jgi:hypothetical protein
MTLDDYLTPSRTRPRLIEALRTLALVRYATLPQLQTVRKPFRQHIYTKQSFERLLQLGLVVDAGGAFRVGPNGLKLLDLPEHYQKRCRGQGKEHDLAITDILLGLTAQEDFFTVFYPRFPYVRPDACVIYKRDGEFKIEFLEVETTDKEAGYLERKQVNYERLANDYKTYSVWWNEWGDRFRLKCKPDDFCFCVVCHSKVKRDWDGWRFVNGI